jgi:hypothetical protein
MSSGASPFAHPKTGFNRSAPVHPLQPAPFAAHQLVPHDDLTTGRRSIVKPCEFGQQQAGALRHHEKALKGAAAILPRAVGLSSAPAGTWPANPQPLSRIDFVFTGLSRAP